MNIQTLIEQAWEHRRKRIHGNTVEEYLPSLNVRYRAFHDRIPVFAGMLPPQDFHELRRSIQCTYRQNLEPLPTHIDATLLNTRIVREGYAFEIVYVTRPVDDFCRTFSPRAAEMQLLLKTISTEKKSNDNLYEKIDSYLNKERRTTLRQLRKEVREDTKPSYSHAPHYQFEGDINGITIVYTGLLASLNEERPLTTQKFFAEFARCTIYPYSLDKKNPTFQSLQKQLLTLLR